MDVIEVKGLAKRYPADFLGRKKTVAVDGITFAITSGETFGFLGPNGAGKTTTIRMLMSLIAPSAGTARIFGDPVPSRRARARVGFLPEAPYFYDYLTVTELCDLAGRIFGLDRATRRRRAEELIERVGLSHARKRPIRKYSKGMLQRAGIAQALMNDPDLVVLDEPTSGLDPVGRREVSDIIADLRRAKKTVFFSSHILADVEQICDRVAIVVGGKIRDIGTVAEVSRRDAAVATDVVLDVAAIADDVKEELRAGAGSHRHQGDDLVLTVEPGADTSALIARAIDAGAAVRRVTPKTPTLEDVFLRRVRESRVQREEKS
ncbi:MAG TPA: ABC transporter ATP-binding protein [Kofleriaceae bacterium]|nr:ABC transporter ATP-binding protein [Kofleriaceae bacterium]